MNYEVPHTDPTPLKMRADFIAGYDAGMADAKRMREHELRELETPADPDAMPDYEPAKPPKRKIAFECRVDKRMPVFAFGFVSPSEFVVVLWPVEFRIAMRY